MHTSPDILPIVPATIPVARGVYSEQIEPHDERIYYAITSLGQLLNGELRHRMPDESEAMVIRDLLRDLDRQDPTDPIPPRLALVR